MFNTVESKSCLETKITDTVNSNNNSNKLLSFEEVKEIMKRVLNDDVTMAILYEVPEQAEYVIKKGVFKHEIKFHGTIMPLLCEGYYGKPTCYKVRDNLMVFEDLDCKDYSTRNKLFDETLVRAGLSSVARLHPALLAETRLDVSFNRLYPDTFTERAFTRDEQSRKWLEVGFNVAVSIAENHEYDFHLIRATCERIYDITKPSCTKTNVVSHGDLWGNNLMFNNDMPPNCLLLNYQLLRYSPLAHDITQFLYLCTDRSFRKVRKSAMLQYYYDVMQDLARSRVASKTRLVRSGRGHRGRRLGAVIIAVVLFPTVLMEENIGAQIMGDSVSYAEYCFGDRIKFVSSIMKQDSVYERRINEIVIELVELASQLDQLPKPS